MVVAQLVERSASYTIDARFEYGHQQYYLMLTVFKNLYLKDENTEKEAGNDQIL